MCDSVWEMLGQEPQGLLLCFNELSGALEVTVTQAELPASTRRAR